MLPTHLRQVFFGHLQWGKRTQNGNYKVVQEKYFASRCFENDLQLVIQITSEVSWKHNTKTSWKGSWYFYQTVCLHQTAQHPVSLPLLLLNLQVKNGWSGNETHRVDSLLFVALFTVACLRLSEDRRARIYIPLLWRNTFRVTEKAFKTPDWAIRWNTIWLNNISFFFCMLYLIHLLFPISFGSPFSP